MYSCFGSFDEFSGSNNSKNTLGGPLDAEKIAEAVLLYVLWIAFPTSHLNSTFRICWSLVQERVVQCSLVQYSAVHFSTVQTSAVQCNAVYCSAVHCNTLQCSAVKTRFRYSVPKQIGSKTEVYIYISQQLLIAAASRETSPGSPLVGCFWGPWVPT